MTAQNRVTLKSYFETGDKPTQAQFADLVDSYLSLTDTAAQVVASNVAVSGAFTGHGGGTLHGFTLNTPTVSAGTLNAPIINSPTVSAGVYNSPVINTPTVSAGTFASPVMTTPTLGAASASSLTFSSTSGIIGTTTNDSAAAGSVGQFVESVVTFGSPATGFSTGTAKTVTSISLTAGDWDVSGQIITVPNGATTTSGLRASISQTNNTHDSPEYLQLNEVTTTAGKILSVSLARRRISLNATTTIYLVSTVDFGINTMAVAGFINARRIR